MAWYDNIVNTTKGNAQKLGDILAHPVDAVTNQLKQGALYKNREALAALLHGDTAPIMSKLNEKSPANPMEAVNFGLGIAPLGITAYHGTPHEIEGLKFDKSKIGTGEGAQAYSHGFYFAEAPNVAKGYAKELGTKIDVNGNPIFEKGKIVGSTGNPELDDYLVANLGDVKASKQNILGDIKEIREYNPSGVKSYQKMLADLRKLNVNKQDAGNLYTVDIADESIPKMLDWDLPLNKQNNEIQAMIKSQMPEKSWEIMQNRTGKQYYQDYWNGNSQPQWATDQMNKLGISGVKYLDKLSRGSDNGTRNYVVYDPETIKILQKNGIDLP